MRKNVQQQAIRYLQQTGIRGSLITPALRRQSGGLTRTL